MHKKSIALAILGAFIPRFSMPQVQSVEHDSKPVFTKAGKGQLRQCKSKPSGAAAFKRAAKKRNNIRKHK